MRANARDFSSGSTLETFLLDAVHEERCVGESCAELRSIASVSQTPDWRTPRVSAEFWWTEVDWTQMGQPITESSWRQLEQRGKKEKTAWSSTRGKMGHKWLNVLLIRGNAMVKSSSMRWKVSAVLLLNAFAHLCFKNTLVGKKHNLKKSFKGTVYLKTRVPSSFMHP